MKKICLFLFATLAFASTQDFNDKNIESKDLKNFEVVSSRLAYSMAKKDEKKIKELEGLLYNIDKKSSEEFLANTAKVEKIFVRIFKTEKNLVPKVIKYIYFDPMVTEDQNIVKDEMQKILVSYYANDTAKIYINNKDNKAEKFITSLINSGAKKENLIIFNNSDSKNILKDITMDIKKLNPGVNEFGVTQMRVLVIGPVSQTKQNLSLATVIFDKSFKGIEIDDFSYLDISRKILESTTDEVRLQSYEQLINGMY